MTIPSWSTQARELLDLIATLNGDHPSIDGPADQMAHFLTMRGHPLGNCSDMELSAIMSDAAKLIGQAEADALRYADEVVFA